MQDLRYELYQRLYSLTSEQWECELVAQGGIDEKRLPDEYTAHLM